MLCECVICFVYYKEVQPNYLVSHTAEVREIDKSIIKIIINEITENKYIKMERNLVQCRNQMRSKLRECCIFFFCILH